MINKVRKYIRKYDLFQKGDRVIVGVSGGADSMALLSVMNRLKDELGIDLVVSHLNHGLRDRESDDDCEWVKRTSDALGLSFLSKKIDVGELSQQTGMSLEDTARRERYAFFYQLLQDIPANRIALGHQFHDQAETVMLNLLRGAGARGLRGIMPIRDHVLVRPLLGIKRDEILAYLEKEKIDYREDESNQSELFLRNRVRHELLPYMKKYNPQIEGRLHSLAETMRIENDYLEEQISAILKRWEVGLESEEIVILIEDFQNLHEAMQRRVIKSILESRSQEQNGIGQTHITAVIDLARDGHVGQKLSLPFTTEVLRTYNQLVFKKQIHRRSKERALHDRENSQDIGLKDLCPGLFEYPVSKIPDEIEIKEAGTRLRLTTTGPMLYDFKAPISACIDYDKIEFPIIIRNIRPGDRFLPLCMTGSKKIKSFFIDRKIPRELRQRVPLLVDRKAILWIAGMAISDRVKVTTSTSTCLKIEII
jgi:tRNA(Ile)-lysidine synthase